MAGGWLAVVSVLLFCSLQLSTSQQQLTSFSLSEAPSSVAVSSENGEVFIAAGTQLLRLSHDLGRRRAGEDWSQSRRRETGWMSRWRHEDLLCVRHQQFEWWSDCDS